MNIMSLKNFGDYSAEIILHSEDPELEVRLLNFIPTYALGGTDDEGIELGCQDAYIRNVAKGYRLVFHGNYRFKRENFYLLVFKLFDMVRYSKRLVKFAEIEFKNNYGDDDDDYADHLNEKVFADILNDMLASKDFSQYTDKFREDCLRNPRSIVNKFTARDKQLGYLLSLLLMCQTWRLNTRGYKKLRDLSP